MPNGHELVFSLDEFQKPCARAWLAEAPSGVHAVPHDRSCATAQIGGARRDRTDDLMLAKHALSQLSYGPVRANSEGVGSGCSVAQRCGEAIAARDRLFAIDCSRLAARHFDLVGLGRLELPTSRLSSARSNQLSYKPKNYPHRGPDDRPDKTSSAVPKASRESPARARPGRKRNEDGEVPPMDIIDPETDVPSYVSKRSDRSA